MSGRLIFGILGKLNFGTLPGGSNSATVGVNSAA